jgi:hypothetical protein
MASDIAGVFTYDFPDEINYLNVLYKAIIKDRLLEELDEAGGPILVNYLEIHVLTTALPSITNGAILIAKGNQKVVQRSMLSEDGNELIIYARAA